MVVAVASAAVLSDAVLLVPAVQLLLFLTETAVAAIAVAETAALAVVMLAVHAETVLVTVVVADAATYSDDCSDVVVLADTVVFLHQ